MPGLYSDEFPDDDCMAGSHLWVWYIYNEQIDAKCYYEDIFFSQYMSELYIESLNVTDSSSGMYLSLDHIDTDGNIYYRVNGVSYGSNFLTAGTNTFDYDITNDIETEFTSSSTSYSTSNMSAYSFVMDWTDVSLPVDGTYYLGLRVNELFWSKVIR